MLYFVKLKICVPNVIFVLGWRLLLLLLLLGWSCIAYTVYVPYSRSTAGYASGCAGIVGIYIYSISDGSVCDTSRTSVTDRDFWLIPDDTS